MAVDDCVLLHAIFRMPGVRRYIFDDELIAPEQTAAIVSKSVTLFAERGLGLWLARLRPSGHPPGVSDRGPGPEPGSSPVIGFGGFWFFREPPELELLYGVVDGEAGRGYGREIAQGIIRYGFETLNMPVVRASCDAAHTVSCRLLEAIGFAFERRERVGGLDTVFYELRKKGSDPFSE